jgi:hypothetical protein
MAFTIKIKSKTISHRMVTAYKWQHLHRKKLPPFQVSREIQTLDPHTEVNENATDYISTVIGV